MAALGGGAVIGEERPLGDAVQAMLRREHHLAHRVADDLRADLERQGLLRAGNRTDDAERFLADVNARTIVASFGLGSGGWVGDSGGGGGDFGGGRDGGGGN